MTTPDTSGNGSRKPAEVVARFLDASRGLFQIDTVPLAVASGVNDELQNPENFGIEAAWFRPEE